MSMIFSVKTMTKYYLKEHVTDEMLQAVGFYKTPYQHHRCDVNNNHHVIVDKNTHEVNAVKYDFQLLKLVDIESDKLQDLLDLNYVGVRND